MDIRKLEKNDYKNYLNLMNQFRPIQQNLDFDTFSNIYDQIFKSNEIYVALMDKNIIGSITVIYEQKFINNCATCNTEYSVFSLLPILYISPILPLANIISNAEQTSEALITPGRGRHRSDFISNAIR